MADYLEPVVATFLAQADKYLGPVKDMRTAAMEAAKANDALIESCVQLDDVLDDVAVSAAAAGQRLDYMGSVFGEVASQANDTRDALAEAGVMASSLTRRFGNLVTRTGVLRTALELLDEELDKKKAALGAVAGDAAMMALAMKALAGMTEDSGNATRDAGTTAAAGMRLWGTGIRLTGAALHWLIMGTLEIASTALPALVAFGAGVAGMASTFDTIGARMTDLVIASGGVRQALLNSVGPLHTLGLGYGTLTRELAPAAYQIFGSVINDLSGKVGVFSKMAQGAGNALASFASKITSDLAGPAGQQLAGFFANAVKYMVQWGQLLGNLGHAFLNIMSSMMGVGQLLLDVLVVLSRAFLALTSNKIVAGLIGVGAAFSALYRYAVLLGRIFTWLGGTVLLNVIRYLFAAGVEAVAAAAEFGILAGAATMLDAVLTPLIAFLAGPVGIALGAVALGLGAWYLLTRQTSTATTQLISHVQAMPPTLGNLSKGLSQLTGALSKAPKAILDGTNSLSRFTGTAYQANPAIGQLTTAIERQARQLLNLRTGMAEMGGPAGSVNADMEALAIQSGLADTKVSQVNSALDAFMQGVTAGQAGVAGFVTSIRNIGQVAGTTTNNLGTSTASMSLSVKQFADELGKGTVRGAGAWTNFTQIVGSTMPQLADWFRTAGAEGAITSSKMQQAFLDMAAGMTKFLGRTAQGRSDLVAFANAQGLNIHTFPQLEAAIKKNHASLDGLNKITADTSEALGNLSKMAQNTADVMSSQVASAISNAALKSSGFYTDINNLTKAMSNNNTTGHNAAYWEAQAAAAYAKAGKEAVTAAGHVSALAAAQAKLHSATYTITTDFVTSGSIPGAGGRHYQGGQGGTGNSVMVVHQHIAGSVLSDQQLARAAQGAGLRQTLRNGSTQAFIPGRLH